MENNPITKRKVRSDKFVFSESDFKRIEKMAAFGLSIQQISAVYGISTDTFYRRCKEVDYDISAAVMGGKAKAVYKVASKAYELAVNGDKTMIKYYLSTIGGWSEKTEIKLQSPDELKELHYREFLQEAIDKLSDEELDQLERLCE